MISQEIVSPCLLIPPSPVLMSFRINISRERQVPENSPTSQRLLGRNYFISSDSVSVGLVLGVCLNEYFSEIRILLL